MSSSRARPPWSSAASCSSAATASSSPPPSSITIEATAIRWLMYGVFVPLRVWPPCVSPAYLIAS
jgi:hypothetical protein